MGRVLAIAAALYACGHPGLDAYRPSAFDRSLREFHRDVNRLAGDAIRTVLSLDQVQALRTLHALSASFPMPSGH